MIYDLTDVLGLAKYVFPDEIFKYFELINIDAKGRELHW